MIPKVSFVYSTSAPDHGLQRCCSYHCCQWRLRSWERVAERVQRKALLPQKGTSLEVGVWPLKVLASVVSMQQKGLSSKFKCLELWTCYGKYFWYVARIVTTCACHRKGMDQPQTTSASHHLQLALGNCRLRASAWHAKSPEGPAFLDMVGHYPNLFFCELEACTVPIGYPGVPLLSIHRSRPWHLDGSRLRALTHHWHTLRFAKMLKGKSWWSMFIHSSHWFRFILIPIDFPHSASWVPHSNILWWQFLFDLFDSGSTRADELMKAGLLGGWKSC